MFINPNSIQLKGVLAIIGVMVLAGCASTRLYRASDDVLAQKTQKTYSEVDLKSTVASERLTLAEFSRQELEAVRRDQISIRDSLLMSFLVASDKASWDDLEQAINIRYKILFDGTSKESKEIEELFLPLEDNYSKLEPLRKSYAADTKGKINLQCPVVDSQRPRPDQPELMIRAFEDACNEFLRLRKEINTKIGKDSQLGKISNKLLNIENKKNALDLKLEDAKKSYEVIHEEIKKKNLESEQVQKLADKLNKQLELFEKIEKTPATLADDKILSQLFNAGKLEKLKSQQKLVDELIQALKGNVSENAKPALIQIAALSGFANAITRSSSSQVSLLILQSELLRLEAMSLEKRITRAQNRITLFQKQRDAIYDEIFFLRAAERSLLSYKTHIDCKQQQTIYTTYKIANQGCRLHLGRALANYANALTLGKMEQEIIDYQIIAQGHDSVLDDSESAFAQTDSLIRIPLEQLALFYAGGIKPQELLAILQAIAMAAIAVGVY